MSPFKIKYTYCLYITVLIITFSGCDYHDTKLEIVNNTSSAIFAETYNDTIPPFPSLNKTEFYLDAIIYPNKTYSPSIPELNGWKREIYRSKNNKLNIFVFQLDSLNKYKHIDTLIRREKYQIYSYSEQMLENKKWIAEIK